MSRRTATAAEAVAVIVSGGPPGRSAPEAVRDRWAPEVPEEQPALWEPRAPQDLPERTA